MDAYKIQKTDDADGESLARVRWAWACVPIELKSTASKAPFAKANSKHFFTGGQLGRLARGQIADYAAMILNHQHRVFCFMIVITGVEARLLRWDRAGAVVTNAFDLTDSEQVKPMYRFLYRLSKMTAEQRGYDPTVVPASNDEITSMNVARDALPESDYRRKRIAAAMTRGWQIQKIRMREEDVVSVEAWRRAGQDSTSAPTDSSSLSSSVQAGVAPCSTPSSTPPNAHAPASSDSRNETGSADSGGRYFLVGKPEHHTDSPIGRGTRGYIAYDMKTGKFVFLRDSWRYETSKSEIKVYEQLHRNRVRHIATPICGGDVIGQDNSPQQTCAQEFDKDKKMPKYIHNRLVVEEIGISLLEFPTGRDLVVVMTHALIVTHLTSEAHEDAWKFAEVMHRDISVANILMLPDANPEAVGVSYKEELGAATQRSRSVSRLVYHVR
ncbi:hypothetical protein POSPLADRAFT_1162002 [Postia placenta MAD-698-R-SB12]|uniref:Fungal-type protein kinase domain-containing protein n=1 Tax=Postia placenta MAD-698-R-SB12 TaxID=670580 RepID=A0A1X6MHX3_9APHY|nr:hypothetical protein POSPLADRAFT_1162002 [Postia placenta MAD-698-R-SB12]OSX55950.1 hypothetical protein POSPLADRAFT_1162002 [Postia placenta MAD-698-R-SB12]